MGQVINIVRAAKSIAKCGNSSYALLATPHDRRVVRNAQREECAKIWHCLNASENYINNWRHYDV